ncbi:MAG: OmpH family outer membrane protein [Bacteroidia bacterium]
MKSILAVIVLGIIVTALYSFKTSKKIAYINTAEVFNGFHMTKKTEAEIKKAEASRKTIMDSLTSQLKKIQAGVLKVSEQELAFIKTDYVEKRNRFNEDLKTFRESAVEKVWKQINQYVADYGKENGYDVILGANGQGSLMYASESAEITTEILRYANNKYEGIK